MHCNKTSFQEFLICYDNDIKSNNENNVWSNAENFKKLNNAKNYEHNYLSPTYIVHLSPLRWHYTSLVATTI